MGMWKDCKSSKVLLEDKQRDLLNLERLESKGNLYLKDAHNQVNGVTIPTELVAGIITLIKSDLESQIKLLAKQHKEACLEYGKQND